MAVHEHISDRAAQTEPGQAPHPVSLETIALVEQALAAMLRAWGQGPGREARAAGEAEYASWFPTRH